ncbi:MAG TPA: hypothetical protein VGB97_02815 [Candidatus Paceibacterota bacterium]|jgi:hypothetical protein
MERKQSVIVDLFLLCVSAILAFALITWIELPFETTHFIGTTLMLHSYVVSSSYVLWLSGGGRLPFLAPFLSVLSWRHLESFSWLNTIGASKREPNALDFVVFILSNVLFLLASSLTG